MSRLSRLSFTDKLAISGYALAAIAFVGFRIYMSTGDNKHLFEPGYESGNTAIASEAVSSAEAATPDPVVEDTDETVPSTPTDSEEYYTPQPYIETASTIDQPTYYNQPSQPNPPQDTKPDKPKPESPEPEPSGSPVTPPVIPPDPPDDEPSSDIPLPPHNLPREGREET